MPEANEKVQFIPALDLISHRGLALHMVERAMATETSIKTVRLEDVHAKLVFAKIPATRVTADELFGQTAQYVNWDRVFKRYRAFVNVFADGDWDHVALFVPLHIRIPRELADLVRKLADTKENAHAHA